MCHKIIRAILCLALGAFMPGRGEASTLRYITTTDGLSFGSVTSIMQDPTGMMWFGTIDGLNLFGGHRLYNFSDNYVGHDLNGSMVSALCTTSDGSTWIQTNEGLHRFLASEDLFEFYPEFSEYKGKSEH